MTITAQERSQLVASIERRERELAQAIDELEQYIAEQDEPHTARSADLRYAHSRQIATMRTSLENAKRLLASATVEPEPDPDPAPAAPPMRIPAPTRFPVTIARWSSTCGLTGKRIRINDVITNYRGVWALYDEAVADDDRRRREGNQRRSDQAFVDQFLIFIDRSLAAAPRVTA